MVEPVHIRRAAVRHNAGRELQRWHPEPVVREPVDRRHKSRLEQRHRRIVRIGKDLGSRRLAVEPLDDDAVLGAVDLSPWAHQKRRRLVGVRADDDRDRRGVGARRNRLERLHRELVRAWPCDHGRPADKAVERPLEVLEDPRDGVTAGLVARGKDGGKRRVLQALDVCVRAPEVRRELEPHGGGLVRHSVVVPRHIRLEDGLREKTPRERRGHVHPDRHRTRRLALERHARRVAAERRNVLLHPLHRQPLVLQAHVAGHSDVALVAENQPPQRPQPVVDGHKDRGRPAHNVLSPVERNRAGALRKRAAMDEQQNGKLVSRLRSVRRPHIEHEARLALDWGHVGVVVRLRAAGPKVLRIEHAAPGLRRLRRREAVRAVCGCAVGDSQESAIRLNVGVVANAKESPGRDRHLVLARLRSAKHGERQHANRGGDDRHE
eukprot:Amastigsp_a510096_16.p2 type:complete len:436 gc:universal Amastigsp_a510096_16:1325-18(-)